MSRATPEEAFAEARAAMERGDWEGFCACLDAETLLRIAENGVGRLLAGGPATGALLAGLCREHAVPDEMVVSLRARLQRLAESGRAAVSPEARSDPRAMVEASLRHKRVVDEYRASLKSTLKAVPELARFTAALERALRAESGGGSMSTRLFVGEALEEMSITGTKAWATRRSADGHADDVGFVRKKGEWYIRPLAKRHEAGRG
jgi:hypothetical protein